jgi:hypothetical protein
MVCCMPPTKKRMIAADVVSGVAERLQTRAEEQGLTLRELSSRILESAALGRSDGVAPAPPERSAAALATPEPRSYVPVRLRVQDDVAEGVPPYERPRPPIREGDTALPPDPEEASRIFGRELQLVRQTSTWRKLVQEGLLEELLRSPAERPE